MNVVPRLSVELRHVGFTPEGKHNETLRYIVCNQRPFEAASRGAVSDEPDCSAESSSKQDFEKSLIRPLRGDVRRERVCFSLGNELCTFNKCAFLKPRTGRCVFFVH
ncbi:hypothetical protein CesoFtcFv8_008323 [Champsocephalus esox]|uniref:Uncharacterized protein n=1 Tax=Champsocephalus esox TaxID=159716 RepID=A0AAN8H1U1_9TELE|nr:hypothetical protein CesoFtcFv8_008323 [Champsocephalus esox]